MHKAVHALTAVLSLCSLWGVVSSTALAQLQTPVVRCGFFPTQNGW